MRKGKQYLKKNIGRCVSAGIGVFHREWRSIRLCTGSAPQQQNLLQTA